MRILALAVLAGCSFRVGATAPPSGADDAPSGGGDDDAPPPLTGDAALDAPADAAPTLPFLLTGLRWLMPCTSADLGNHNCSVGSPLATKVALGGVASQHFLVTAHIRGAMEAIGYHNGLQVAGAWYSGGVPNDNADNIYELSIDHPPQTYWLNPGVPTTARSFKYDYEVTFMADGNATATFTSSGQDNLQWANWDGTAPISFPGVTTNPDPYNGQFADLVVESAVLQ